MLRALRARGLALPVNHTRERRQLAEARRRAFAVAPTGRNQVWQLDFSEFETIAGGVWRIAGCAEDFTKYEFGWHVAAGCTARDAIAAVTLAIVEAEALLRRGAHRRGHRPGHRSDPAPW